MNDETVLHEIRKLIEDKIDKLEHNIKEEICKLEKKIDSLSLQHDKTKDNVIRHDQVLLTMKETDKGQQETLENLKTKTIELETKLATVDIEKAKVGRWVQWIVPIVWAIIAFAIGKYV